MAANKSGLSHARIAKEMRVSAITRLLALYRETGSYETRPMYTGRKPRLDEETLRTIEKRIGEQPDIALHELIEEYHLPVSVPALCKTINGKLGLRRKKNGTRSRAVQKGRSLQGAVLEAEPDNP